MSETRTFARALSWLAVSGLFLVAFVVAGRWSISPVDVGNVGGWLDETEPIDAFVEVARWIGIVLAGYVVVVSLLVLASEAAAAVRLVSVSRLLSRTSRAFAVPIIRKRLVEASAATALTASVVSLTAGGFVSAAGAVPVGAPEQTVDSATEQTAVETMGAVRAVDPADVVTVTVKRGDTLVKLARDQYGDTVDRSTIEWLAGVNDLADANLIFPGQQLQFPSLGSQTVPPPVVTDASWATRTTVAGDTVWELIETHYGVVSADMVWTIAEVNQLENPDEISVGMQLVLPPIGVDGVLITEQITPPEPSAVEEVVDQVDVVEGPVEEDVRAVIEAEPLVPSEDLLEVAGAPSLSPATALPVSVPVVDDVVEVADVDAGLMSVRDVRPVWLAGVTGATALATALWMLVRARRRRTAARGGGKVSRFARNTVTIDEALRASADADLVNWANAELADLVSAHGLNESRSLPVMVELSREGGLTVHWDPPHGGSPRGWEVNDAATSWSQRFDPDHGDFGMAPVAIPGLVTVGLHCDRHVLIDVESCGALCVFGDAISAESLVRSMVLELGAGGVLSNAHVHTVGLDLDGTEHLDRVRSRTEGEALEHLRTIRLQHDHVLNQAERSSMLEVRSAASPEGREVTVVVVRASACVRLGEMIEAAQPQRGVAVVVVGEVDGIASIEIDSDQTAHIDPLGVTVGASGVSRQVASTLAVHLDQLHGAVESNDVVEPPAVEERLGDVVEPNRMVRVLGKPFVEGGEPVSAVEVELLAFLAANGGSASDDEIAAALTSARLGRSAVWSLVSGVRSLSGDLLAPTEEGSNVVVLADGCVSDADWMRHVAWRSHALDDSEAVDELTVVLESVTALPYESVVGYDWAMTSGAFGLAVQAIERTGFLLAARAMACGRNGDAAGVLRAVLSKLGANEPLTQALVRLERDAGNDSGAQDAIRHLSRELVFMSGGVDPAGPSPGTTTLLDADATLMAMDAAVAPDTIDAKTEPVAWRETMRPTVVLRTFGDVCAEGAGKTQALAAVFAVAAAGRKMTNGELVEVTGYGTKTLSSVFTTEHEILERGDGELSLRSGVWTDHQWIAECARRAGEADREGNVHDVADWLHTLFAEVGRIDGEAFARVPGKKAYWDWVDEFPGDVSARAAAENEMVAAVLAGIDVWATAQADDQIPADVVVGAACNLARLAPYAAVAGSVRPAEIVSGGECLLRAAHGVAVGRVDLVHTVVSTAQQLVATDKIEASDSFADAIGL